MKVLFINGSPHKDGTTVQALEEVERVLKEEGIETARIDVPADTASCMACLYCHEKKEGCIRKDIVNDTYELLDDCDGLIVATPVYYAGPTGSILSFLDRLFYSYPRKQTLNLKAAAVISNSRRSGNLTANDAVSKFFSISGMSIITSTYWNDTHGRSRAEQLQDEEGLQTMRNLGRNMAYYLKMRRLAKENGLMEPVIEKDKKTDFCR